MAIQKRAAEPVGITNASGEPEIVLSVGELTLSMTPPKAGPPPDHGKPPASGETDDQPE
jgi:hypothetical protein